MLIKKEISKSCFEEIISKSTLYLLVNFLTDCVPPLLAPLTSPYKNFNRATFTTYYIKKIAADFTINRVLLMLNAYFCFNKEFFYRFIAFIIIVSDFKRLPGRQTFLKCYRSAGSKKLRTTDLK